MKYGEPRIFHLVRHDDVSAVSGVGVVAEGIQWSDGSVAVRWHGEWPSVVTYETGIRAVVAIHGHGGATEVRWLEESGDAP